MIAKIEIVVSGIEDVEAVEEFYDFALEELAEFQSLSQDLEECVLVDDGFDEFDEDIDVDALSEEELAELNEINFEETARRRRL